MRCIIKVVVARWCRWWSFCLSKRLLDQIPTWHHWSCMFSHCMWGLQCNTTTRSWCLGLWPRNSALTSWNKFYRNSSRTPPPSSQLCVTHWTCPSPGRKKKTFSRFLTGVGEVMSIPNQLLLGPIVPQTVMPKHHPMFHSDPHRVK